LSLTNVGPIWLAPPGTAADVANVASDIQQTTLDMATGRFIFRNVRPGSYELSTIMNGMYARANVEVRESHIENLSLDLTRGVDLTVRFLAEEGASGIAPLALLLPYLGDDPPSPREAMRGEAPKDGRATIRNVPPDDYRVYLEPLLTSAVAPTSSIPPALQQVYIKSIMLGTDDALNAPLHFKGDPDVTLDIIIGANPAVLEGVVLDASGAPVRGAIVSLLPNANSTSRNRVFRRDMYRMVISDLEGRFKATGIPPGDYKVFAWAGIERNGWLDPDLQHAYEDRGVSVKVEERSAVTLELHLIVPGL
jgi:protocatechuate 3,4-dioxygenase beta subunit